MKKFRGLDAIIKYSEPDRGLFVAMIYIMKCDLEGAITNNRKLLVMREAIANCRGDEHFILIIELAGFEPDDFMRRIAPLVAQAEYNIEQYVKKTHKDNI